MLWDIIASSEHHVEFFERVFEGGVGPEGTRRVPVVGVDASALIRSAASWSIGGNLNAVRARILSRMSWLLGLPATIYFVVNGPFPPRSRPGHRALNLGAIVQRMVEDYGFQWTEVQAPETVPCMLARLASAGAVDYVISDEPDALMYGLDALVAWPVDTDYRPGMYRVHQYELSPARRYALIVGSLIERNIELLSNVDRDDLATFVGQMSTRGLVTILVNLALGTSATSVAVFRTRLLVLINTTRTVHLPGLPSSFPELDFIRLRLEPATATFPTLVYSRGVLTPNVLAITSAYAMVFPTSSPLELHNLMCTSGFWPGLCLRAMIGSARGTGTFPTIPVPYHLLSTPPYRASTSLPSLIDLIVWPEGPAQFVQVNTHWPGVPAYRMTFTTSPIVRAVKHITDEPLDIPEVQARCEVFVPRSIVHAAEVIGSLFDM